MKLTTALTQEQTRFVLWIKNRAPDLLLLFDFNKRECLPEVIDRYLSVASHGQTIMARFVLGVWLHSNDYDFNVIEAASTLDKKNMDVITGWLQKPFWP